MDTFQSPQSTNETTERAMKLLRLAKLVAKQQPRKWRDSIEVRVITNVSVKNPHGTLRRAKARTFAHDTIGVTDYGNIITPAPEHPQAHILNVWRSLKTIDDLQKHIHQSGGQLLALESFLESPPKRFHR